MKNSKLLLILSTIISIATILLLFSCSNSSSDKSGISFNTLTVNGSEVYGEVSNDTKYFSFADEITTHKKYNYIVTYDITGTQPITSKTIELSTGDNTVYVTEMTNNEPTNTYIVTIRRKPIYTVTFNTYGGTTVSAMTVEEGKIISEPHTSREGYTFVCWNYDFNTPITINTQISAIWRARDDIGYKVEYYLENFKKDGYDLVETVNLFGTAGAAVTAESKSFEHFTFNSTSSNVSGNISGDGSLVLKAYYTRNVYSVYSNNTAGGVNNAGRYVYQNDNEVTLVASVLLLGYDFGGWYCGDQLLSTNSTFTTVLSSNIEARFVVKSEMQNFIFTSTENQCIVTGVKDTSINEITIPACVTGIGDWAFKNCAKLTNVVIPDSVNNIGEYVFYGCSALEKMTVPFIGKSPSPDTPSRSAVLGYFFGTLEYTGGVETEQQYKLYNWVRYYIPTSLKSVTVTGTTLPFGAFQNCSNLTNISFSDEITRIEDYTFSGCTNLINITIPSKVTSIGDYAFRGCEKFTEVTVPNNVTTIGRGAFGGCSGLESITIPFVGKHIDSETFESHFGYIFGYNEVSSAFSYHCKYGSYYYIYYIPANLKTVILSDELKCIKENAFRKCNTIANVIIPNSVESIETSAFEGCSSLTSITIPFLGNERSSKGYKSHFGYIFGYSSSLYYNGETHYHYKWGDYYYTYNIPTSLNSVILTDGITTINDYAFYYCKHLVNITIPKSIIDIGRNAFYKCSALTDVYYLGNSSDWAKINIGDNNDSLTTATRHEDNFSL